DPARVDEVIVTPQFAAVYHKRVGDTLTLLLASVKQANEQYDGTTGPPRGPAVRARITGVGRSPWLSIGSDSPGQKGGVQASSALYDRYRANILGHSGQSYINALIRLKGGTAAIPAFRADLARVTGRSDIDVWNNRENFGNAVERITRYEAACLFAFASYCEPHQGISADCLILGPVWLLAPVLVAAGSAAAAALAITAHHRRA